MLPPCRCRFTPPPPLQDAVVCITAFPQRLASALESIIGCAGVISKMEFRGNIRSLLGPKEKVDVKAIDALFEELDGDGR